jgi:hypothetical protein
VFRIRIHWVRIRIQYFRLNTDPDPGFDKNCKNLQLEKNLIFFWSKIVIYLSLGLHNGHPSSRRSLQPSKGNIQSFKPWNFCPSGSGFRKQIQIHWPDWIRILLACIKCKVHKSCRKKTESRRRVRKGCKPPCLGSAQKLVNSRSPPGKHNVPNLKGQCPEIFDHGVIS